LLTGLLEKLRKLVVLGRCSVKPFLSPIQVSFDLLNTTWSLAHSAAEIRDFLFKGGDDFAKLSVIFVFRSFVHGFLLA
jgi:hypothetical protein